MSARVILFSTDSCTYCEHAKSLLSKRGVAFEEVNLSDHPELQAELAEVTGLDSFPQIVVNGEPLGGLNELRAAESSGLLASWSAVATLPPQLTFYDAVGGEPTFRRIVARFFAQVPQDEVLAAVYPLDDLDGAEERLRLFLIQYWGGPTTYSDERGHPRLRMRHAPFRIGPRERDAWLAAMRVAVDEAGLQESRRAELLGYFESTATHMINANT